MCGAGHSGDPTFVDIKLFVVAEAGRRVVNREKELCPQRRSLVFSSLPNRLTHKIQYGDTVQTEVLLHGDIRGVLACLRNDHRSCF